MLYNLEIKISIQHAHTFLSILLLNAEPKLNEIEMLITNFSGFYSLPSWNHFNIDFQQFSDLFKYFNPYFLYNFTISLQIKNMS